MTLSPILTSKSYIPHFSGISTSNFPDFVDGGNGEGCTTADVGICTPEVTGERDGLGTRVGAVDVTGANEVDGSYSHQPTQKNNIVTAIPAAKNIPRCILFSQPV